jgi:hypothetical protein
VALKDFVSLYLQDPGQDHWRGPGWCSKCGGFAVRRLTEEQFDHYWASLQAAEKALHESR